MDFKNK
jgi:hypothetical protein